MIISLFIILDIPIIYSHLFYSFTHSISNSYHTLYPIYIYISPTNLFTLYLLIIIHYPFTLGIMSSIVLLHFLHYSLTYHSYSLYPHIYSLLYHPIISPPTPPPITTINSYSYISTPLSFL